MRFKFSVLNYFLIPADEIKELTGQLLKVAVSNDDLWLLFLFFFLSLLVTAIYTKPRFGYTDAYFEN